MDEQGTPNYSLKKDFICLEIMPVESDLGNSEFTIFANKRSRVLKTSIPVTWPAFNLFLSATPIGRRLRDAIEQAPTRIGHVDTIDAGHGMGKSYFIMAEFYPLGEKSRAGRKEWELFINMRGEKLGMLIETHLAKYLKRKYPNSMIRNSIVLSGSRINLLANHLGVAEPTEYRTTEAYHALLKKALIKFIQKKRVPPAELLKNNSKINRRQRVAPKRERSR